MRTSERLAAVAVFAMTMPAFLAFPALGLWCVVKVWPGMTRVDRGLFCCAVAVFCAGLPYSFRRRLARHTDGKPRAPTIAETAIVSIPLAAGGWALTHHVVFSSLILAQMAVDIYAAANAPLRDRRCGQVVTRA